MSIQHIFSGDPIDRVDHERRDPRWVEAQLGRSDARFLLFHDQDVLTRSGDRADDRVALGFAGPAALELAVGEASPVLLGLLDGTPYFGLDVSAVTDPVAELGLDEVFRFDNPRRIATEIVRTESGLLAHAKSMVDWHARHRFCAECGARTAPDLGGLQRNCTACKAHHFPRTDPVAIMVVADGDRCLLGRNARRVTGFYSALAGFIAQGESIEEAVRREVREEAGIEVGEVRYHSSQPWPFPSSLMIGCIAEALSTEISIDTEELADVRWFSKDEVLAALDVAGEPGEGLRLPGEIAIAHHIIKAWATKT